MSNNKYIFLFDNFDQCAIIYNKNDDYLNPKIRDKSEKDKSLHEVKIDDLYIRGEYKGQMYFLDLEEAQKRLKELQ